MQIKEIYFLRDVVYADENVKAETGLNAAKVCKVCKVWFAEKIRMEHTAYVAADKPE